MNVFISGGCGQVGSHVAELLLARGDTVVVADNFATGRPEHLAPHPRLTVHTGSIADRSFLDAVFQKQTFDCIVHTAAAYKDPDDWREDALTNTLGGVNLIMLARERAIKRFIYYQTALCYGLNPRQTPITLEHPRFPNNSSYSISKTTTEEYLELSGLSYVSFRLANVVGPRNLSGPVPIFFQRLTTGKPCFVTHSRRDFVFVKDLAAVTAKAVDGVGQGSYNFSSGTDIPILELYDAEVRELGITPYPEPEMRDLGADDAAGILLDPSKTLEDFGPITFTPLPEIIRAACAYYREFGVAGGYTHLKHGEAK
jgi:nucleoside-diphosphate-sugar epimerase